MIGQTTRGRRSSLSPNARSRTRGRGRRFAANDRQHDGGRAKAQHGRRDQRRAPAQQAGDHAGQRRTDEGTHLDAGHHARGDASALLGVGLRHGVGDAAGDDERRAHRAHEAAHQKDGVARGQRHEQRAGGESQAAGGNRHAGGQTVGDHAGRNVGEHARQRLGGEDQPQLGKRKPELVADHDEQGTRSGGHDGRHCQDGEYRDEVGAWACHERAVARPGRMRLNHATPTGAPGAGRGQV